MGGIRRTDTKYLQNQFPELVKGFAGVVKDQNSRDAELLRLEDARNKEEQRFGLAQEEAANQAEYRRQSLANQAARIGLAGKGTSMKEKLELYYGKAAIDKKFGKGKSGSGFNMNKAVNDNMDTFGVDKESATNAAIAQSNAFTGGGKKALDATNRILAGNVDDDSWTPGENEFKSGATDLLNMPSEWGSWI